jgi:hypothetical protein
MLSTMMVFEIGGTPFLQFASVSGAPSKVVAVSKYLSKSCISTPARAVPCCWGLGHAIIRATFALEFARSILSLGGPGHSDSPPTARRNSLLTGANQIAYCTVQSVESSPLLGGPDRSAYLETRNPTERNHNPSKRHHCARVHNNFWWGIYL